MSKHTPGPWVVCGDRAHTRVVSHEGMVICSDQDYPATITDEDARLIAAAPDLLHALKTIVANILEYERVNNLSPNLGKQDCWLSVALANEAIAKAEGTQVSNATAAAT